jgi:hypothetical protein
LINGLVPDPERLPDIIQKHFTEQRAEFVACPWSEVQGGDLDGEHSNLLTHALVTLVGYQHDEAFVGNTMDTQWKKVKCITLSSIKTLEDLTTRLEDLSYSDTTLSQTVGTNLESLMFKSGYDEDLARGSVPMSYLYRISLLGFQYYVGCTLICGKLLPLTAGARQSYGKSNMLRKCVKYANIMGSVSKWSI